MKKTFSDIYQSYQTELEQSPVQVTLLSHTQDHAALSAASARTCYNQKGIVFPQDMQKNSAARDRILQSTLKAGHLTTRQHSHYVFAIENISRNVIWDFFHSHPYYNSEQVSQRYTILNNAQDWYHVPQEIPSSLLPSYHALHQRAYVAYQNLREILFAPILAQLKSIHKVKAQNKSAELESLAQKKAAEFARYVLPVSTYARMYHTVSALTLIRYYHALEISHTAPYPHAELRQIILKMIAEVVKHDADFALDLQKIEFATPQKISLAHAEARKEIHKNSDSQIQAPYQFTQLLHYPQNDGNLSRQLYLQGMDDKQEQNSWACLLSPRYNPAVAESLNRSSQESLARNASLFYFSFYQKISHSADSQEQRHRTLEGTRLNLATQASFAPEYITPTIVLQNPSALALYEDHMQIYFREISALLQKTPQTISFAAYLLPNAYPVRYFTGGNLLNFFHKWKTRLCYNAQQEIFDLSLEQVKQVTHVIPALREFLGAPCHIRSGFIKPICPEGSHYCGVRVWKKSLDEMKRNL